MKTWYVILATSIVYSLLGGGCGSGQVNEAEIVGRYIAELPSGGRETLQLLSNGKCIQEIFRAGVNGVLNAEGEWRYVAKVKTIYLDGVRLSLMPTGEMNPDVERIFDGLVTLTVSKSLNGSVRLGSDEWLVFNREKQQEAN